MAVFRAGQPSTVDRPGDQPPPASMGCPYPPRYSTHMTSPHQPVWGAHILPGTVDMTRPHQPVWGAHILPGTDRSVHMTSQYGGAHILPGTATQGSTSVLGPGWQFMYQYRYLAHRNAMLYYKKHVIKVYARK